MLKTTVKVSHITNLSDARYCAGMGVEMLGFSIEENSVNYVEIKRFQEIRSWVAGVQIVAETDTSEGDDLLEKLQQYQPDAIQVSNAALLPWLKTETDKPLILRLEADQDTDTIAQLMESCQSYVSYFLLESSSDAAFEGDWPHFLGVLAARFPILLGFGLNESVVNLITDMLPQVGIALRGSDEIRPGYKEFGELMDLLELLEED
ncbi:MAG: N-(5'-phosphoribosyl)anthranilate isomerase [Spirosomaceae bacterium]|jgi:phosphoribosylanthranilate isomerase|nr:N-(5'-phosphoribosyl)anthranilate isomerase [Spirosomataceae bacterium]